MRTLILLALVFLLSVTPCSALEEQGRVLFVGNSLTYVGNLPAVFAALAEANGKPIASDMIVRGGATLSGRVIDGSVARAISDEKYTAVVVQERGGDLMCLFGPDSCVQSRRAIKSLVERANETGAKIVLLGTYQFQPDAALRLVEHEAAAAQEAGIPYIEVSLKLWQLGGAGPEFTWLANDGMHPGKDLLLLDASLVYQALFGSLPRPKPLTVTAPIYGSTSGLTESLRQSDAPPPLPDTPREVLYTDETIEKILSVINRAGSN